MSTGRPSPEFVRQLLRLAGQPAGGAVSDRELVRRFALDRSEAAFADLMARHGPLVLGVCRRHLRDPHAADDAFQATFLVLARRAGAVAWRECLAGWLFEVASRVSRKAAAREARRAAREGAPADAAPEPAAPPAPAPAGDLTSLQAALDDELRRLPEKLRLPVVLCHLEGLSQDDVARHLGISDGQLRGRLYRAKQKLQDRLTRRGFSLTAVLLALAVGGRGQALPPVLAAATLRLAAGPPGPVPEAVATLTTTVIQDMSRTIPTFAVALVVGALTLGAGGFAVRAALADAPAAPPSQPLAASRPALPPLAALQVIAKDDDDDKKTDPKDRVEKVEGVIKAVAADKNQLVVNAEDEDDRADRTVTVAAGVKLRFGAKAVALADLRPGMEVVLSYKGNSTDLLEVRAGWPEVRAKAKSVDAAKRELVIPVETNNVEFDVALAIAPDAKVTVDELPAGLADVPPGKDLRVELTLDKKGVMAVEADGLPDTLPGLVKRYDEATKTLLVQVRAAGFREDRVATVGFAVAPGAKVRYAGRDAALTDLKERMPVRLTFTPDRRTVAGVLTADPLPPEVNDDD